MVEKDSLLWGKESSLIQMYWLGRYGMIQRVLLYRASGIDPVAMFAPTQAGGNINIKTEQAIRITARVT